MYLQKRYLPLLYATILRHYSEIEEILLNFASFQDIKRKRELLGRLGVRRIRAGQKKTDDASLNSTRLEPVHFYRALKIVAEETRDYLDKYKKGFGRNSDEKRRDLNRDFGEQLCFDFRGSIPCGTGIVDEGLTREEISGYFRLKRT